MKTLEVLLPSPVHHRHVVDAGDFVTVRLWRSTPEAELPADLLQALREAEADTASAETEARTWAEEAEALETLARRLETAEQRLQDTLRRGPLWAAAAAAFALARLEEERAVDSARDSARWATEKARRSARKLQDARETLKGLQTRATEAALVRWTAGPKFAVRLRRVDGGFTPVHADDPRAVPAAITAARVWSGSRSMPRGRAWADAAAWALERELQRLADHQQALAESESEDEFDSFSDSWLWQEELRRREAADKLLLGSRGLSALREPVLVLLQRDNALQGRAWEAARAWLADTVRQLVSRGVRAFRVPGTARGREAAELIRQLGGNPVVFSLPPRQGDDDLQAAYEAALRGARGLILVAGSAVVGKTPLYLLDPALAATALCAPMVRHRWDLESHRLVPTTEPEVPVPWVRFDVAAAAATSPPAD